MIYFTTFIFTILLSHNTRAVPACGNAASPKDLYNPTYDNVQQPFPIIYPVTSSNFYDNPNGNTKTLVCSKLAEQFPHFKDFLRFPYIGGSFNIKNDPNCRCGMCWELHNPKTRISIFILAIDAAGTGFNISETAFKRLNDGKLVPSLGILATPCDTN